jgi:hypothetical protein
MDIMCRRSLPGRGGSSRSQVLEGQIVSTTGFRRTKWSSRTTEYAIFRVEDDPTRVETVQGATASKPRSSSMSRQAPGRKNLTRLVRAYHILRREFALPHRLVLVGKRTYLSDDIFAVIGELGLEEDVVVLGSRLRTCRCCTRPPNFRVSLAVGGLRVATAGSYDTDPRSSLPTRRLCRKSSATRVSWSTPMTSRDSLAPCAAC